MESTTLKTIGIITSGGDAPGMNACIRAITRTALANQMRVLGFQQGFTGILERNYQEMQTRSVSNIIQRGGTILRSARCAEFMEPEGRQKAAKNLTELGVDILFVIGGNGSLQGAHQLMKIWDGQIIGLPGTIDNDLAGTDYTIGFFTALDTALEAIDKIRDTADSFDRIFLIEVMGRHSGYIAQMVGIASGAEDILIPEDITSLESVSNQLIAAKKQENRAILSSWRRALTKGVLPHCRRIFPKRAVIPATSAFWGISSVAVPRQLPIVFWRQNWEPLQWKLHWKVQMA